MANERKSGLSVHSLIDQENEDAMDHESSNTSQISEHMEKDGDEDTEDDSSTVVAKDDEWRRRSPLDGTMLSPITEGNSGNIISSSVGFGVVLPPLSSIINGGAGVTTFPKSDCEVELREKRVAVILRLKDLVRIEMHARRLQN
ncbi:hypothetical protein HK100_003946 [Physocladia obscura]|uniref:Uncharacterized protein n=1 Tax=Physocladia obscura TaxID=109957 RepID=A0AAD5XJ73_9FUNG|nr:hypothetical protein HK100_003946 [Physocladia obscura]